MGSNGSLYEKQQFIRNDHIFSGSEGLQSRSEIKEKGYRSLSLWFVLALIFTGFQSLQLDAQDWVERPYAGERDSALEQFMESYPDVSVLKDDLGRIQLYGSRFTSGITDDEAVDVFLERHAVAFGIQPGDLELLYATDLPTQEATVRGYRQVIDGIPVEHSAFRLLLRPDPVSGRSTLVYAAGHLAHEPVSGYSPVEISAEEALRLARQDWRGSEQLNWSKAELLIEPSASLRSESRLVYRIVATGKTPAQREDWAINVDPSSGRTLEVRNQILHVDIEGAVEARVTTGGFPDTPSNPPAATPIGGITVSIPGGASTSSNDAGEFVVPYSGVDQVDLQTSLSGQWSTVVNEGGANLSRTTPVAPPGPVLIELNAVYDALQVAEVNAYHYTHLTHDFIRSRTPDGVLGIDVSITTNVNIVDTCNAFFSPGAQSINFFQAGAGCVNTSYASVVSHEYGHFIVDRLGLAQGGFGEGFSDVVSMLQFDDPIIGRDFLGPGTQVRDPISAGIQYPCPSTSVHTCGQILGSSFWLIREGFGAELGSVEGLDHTRQLFVDWLLITIGGVGESSAHPETAIEVLTLDDDDGELGTGTPNFNLICSAFAAHSIDCPVLPELVISFPEGRPQELQPQIAASFRVDVIAGLSSVNPDSGVLFHRQGNTGAFSEEPIVQVSGDIFSATIPEQLCGDEIQYYIRFQNSAGVEFLRPESGAAAPYTALVFTSIQVDFADDMEIDTGWTVGEPTDTATTGIWERVDPIGTAAQPESGHGSGGAVAWITGQGSIGGALGENDIDGGATTLKSPVFDLSGSIGAAWDTEISYWRWYSNGAGATPFTDTAQVEITNDLTNWVVVEVLGPNSGPDTLGGWVQHTFIPLDFISLSDTVQLRFIAQDAGTGSIVEMAIDDLQVQNRFCNIGPIFRRGDPNGDGSVDVSDAVSMLQYLFEGLPISCVDAADFADNGSVNIADPVGLVGFLFGGESPPAQPYPNCGTDINDTDALPDCQTQVSCP